MTDENNLLFDDQDLPPNHRSGFVAVAGRPNVGKSTLLNHYLGQKIAIVSPKPQTTRDQTLGILTLPNAQLIFIDTPGIHQPFHKLGEHLVDVAGLALPDADVVLWLVDGTEPPTKEDRLVVDIFNQPKFEATVVLALNKIDVMDNDLVLKRLVEFTTLYQPAIAVPVSVLANTNLDILFQKLIDLLPEGPRFYPEDQITDQHLRFIAAEMVREAALNLLDKEVPHAIAVQVQEFKERDNGVTYISAFLIVERQSQKGIVIGKKGTMLKKIGALARPQIESLVDGRVYLDLRVKVYPRWRRDQDQLRRLGYATG